MISLPSIQYSAYFIAIMLFLFFYGYTLIFNILRKLKIKSIINKFLIFIFLVLVASFSIDWITNWLIRQKTIGLLAIIILYIATYDRYRREMK